MRHVQLLALPLVLASAPAPAQPPKAEPTLEEDMKLPPELSDPALSGRLVDALQVLSSSFLNLPVGEVETALEGRRATPADRTRTIASESGMTEQELRRKLDESRPAMAGAQKAIVNGLPAMMKAMSQMGAELDKAAANMPRPDYPKR